MLLLRVSDAIGGIGQEVLRPAARERRGSLISGRKTHGSKDGSVCSGGTEDRYSGSWLRWNRDEKSARLPRKGSDFR